MRVRRAAKPQTGGIRHQNDCLVETSNFSSLSARGCERAASLLWPVVPLFRPLGGRCDRRVRKRGPRTPGSPGTITPGKHWGVQMTEVRGGKAPGVCFRKGPRFPGHHGNPGVPSNNKPAARGHLRTFAARSEAHEALPLVALGFPEPPPRVRRGRDWRKKQQKKPSSSSFLIFFSFFSRRENSRFSGNLCLGSSGVEQKSPHSGFRAMSAGSRAQAAGATCSSKRASCASRPGPWDSGSRATSTQLQSTPVPNRGLPPRSKRPFRLPGITSEWKEKSRELPGGTKRAY